jgi:hypothetical protein
MLTTLELEPVGPGAVPTKASSNSFPALVEKGDVGILPETIWSTEMPPGLTTVKWAGVLNPPPLAVTTMFPVVAPAGTVVRMLELLQLLIVAATPLNVTDP